MECPGSCGSVVRMASTPVKGGRYWPKNRCAKCARELRVGMGKALCCMKDVRECTCKPPFAPVEARPFGDIRGCLRRGAMPADAEDGP
eukprot:1839265-Alexandrium_andersonii.AAC.1